MTRYDRVITDSEEKIILIRVNKWIFIERKPQQSRAGDNKLVSVVRTVEFLPHWKFPVTYREELKHEEASLCGQTYFNTTF